MAWRAEVDLDSAVSGARAMWSIGSPEDYGDPNEPLVASLPKHYGDGSFQFTKVIPGKIYRLVALRETVENISVGRKPESDCDYKNTWTKRAKRWRSVRRRKVESYGQAQ